MVQGRNSKLTPELQKKVTDFLAEGCTRRAACGASNISQDSFARYLKLSADFADAVAQAEAEAETKFTKSIWKSATGYDSDWRAAESWLKRRRREEWGDNVAAALPDLSEFDDTELDRIAAGEPIERVLASSRRRRAGKTPTSAEQTEQPDPPPLIA